MSEDAVAALSCFGVIIVVVVLSWLYIRWTNRKRIGVIESVDFTETALSGSRVTKYHIDSDGVMVFAALPGHVNDLSEGDMIEFRMGSERLLIVTVHHQKKNKDGSISRWTEDRDYERIASYRKLPQEAKVKA
jgi:hypothetical protein